MSSNESVEDSCFKQLSEILQVSCARCGHGNGLRALKCVACQAPIEQKESERESLSFLHAEGLDAAAAAHTSSHKLKRLRLALEAMKKGEVTLQVYRDVVGQVYLETQAMQEILALKGLQDLEASLPPEAIDVMRETSHNIDAFAQACQRMLSFDGSSFSLAEEGLGLAEATIVEMEATAREAAELGAEYKAKD